MVKRGRVINKIESFKQKLYRIRDLLLAGSLEPKDYKLINEECQAQISILEESLNIATKEEDRVIQASKNCIRDFCHLDSLYKGLTTVNKKELVRHLFPFGIIYSNSSFSIDNIAESLQLVYKSPDELDKSIHSIVSSKKKVSDPNLIDDTKLCQKLITSIVDDNIYATIRQAKEIVTFFKKIVHLSSQIDAEPNIH